MRLWQQPKALFRGDTRRLSIAAQINLSVGARMRAPGLTRVSGRGLPTEPLVFARRAPLSVPHEGNNSSGIGVNSLRPGGFDGDQQHS